MNETKAATEQNNERMDACDFVELGEVTTETKGYIWGEVYDGGYWWFG